MPDRNPTAEEIERELDPRPLLNALGHDLEQCLELLTADPKSQFARRSYVRAAAAMVEAWIYVTKQVCARAVALAIEPFGLAEFALLRDVAFELKDNGQAFETAKYLSVERNLRFAYRSYAKLTGADCALAVDGADWQAFQKLVMVRNRLMHPKRVVELDVTDHEMAEIERAAQWFMEQTEALYARARETYKNKRKHSS